MKMQMTVCVQRQRLSKYYINVVLSWLYGRISTFSAFALCQNMRLGVAIISSSRSIYTDEKDRAKMLKLFLATSKLKRLDDQS